MSRLYLLKLQVVELHMTERCFIISDVEKHSKGKGAGLLVYCNNDVHR